MLGLKPLTNKDPRDPLAHMDSEHRVNRESRLHRLLTFGGILLLVLLGLAIPALLAYYSLYFFAPGG